MRPRSRSDKIDPESVRDLAAKINALEDKNENLETRLIELEMRLEDEDD